MKKALISTMVSGFLLGSFDLASAAADSAPDITLNGQPVQFTDASPMMMQNRIFVPYRKMFESLGANVTWEQATNTAVAVKEGVTVKLPLGSHVITVNNHPLTMDVSSTTVNDRMMVPIRFVSQSLGATVKWSAGQGAREKIEIIQSQDDMINQLATRMSGDQPVTTEQAGILLAWLKSGGKGAVTVPSTIMGDSQVQAQEMAKFVKAVNPSFNPAIAKAYLEIGKKYGIRGDVAFCQAILETGWFKFDGGTAVTPDQNNFCGMGVTKKGVKGNSFPTIKDGVTAHIQHLFAYAATAKLPSGESVVDPRFTYVTRGIAKSWDDLNNRWAMNNQYGQSILSLYEQLEDISARSAS